MLNRRTFLRWASAAVPVLAVKSASAFDYRNSQGPVIISTWDFGKEANAETWKMIHDGKNVVNAVEAGVRIPEADPNNNSVGYGGLPDRDGVVTLDACIMEGKDLSCGSVAALENIMHPISVARLVMTKTPHVMLVGRGALDFALQNGFKEENLLTPESEAAWKTWLKNSNYKPSGNISGKVQDNKTVPGSKENHDTIGMIAMNASRNFAGACTTSGLAYKIHGRVGDSPLIGAGLYVDDEVGGATSTGVGEEVIRICGSHLVVELMRQGASPENACKEAVKRIIKHNPAKAKTLQVGFIALNKRGEYGAYALQKGFSYAVKTNSTEQIIKSKYFFE